MTVEWSRLERVAQGLDVEIPWPYTIDQFILNVEELRGRTIKIIYFDSGSPITGFDGVTQWWAAPESDYIAIDKHAAQFLQEHGIAHELSHMLLGHQAEPLIKTLASQFRFLSPDTVTRMLKRDVLEYSDPEEADAEALASLIPLLARRTNSQHNQPWAAPSVSSEQNLQRLYVAAWPLWNELIEMLNNPHLEALAPYPVGPRISLQIRRLVIEVLDGLHRLRPHLAAQVAEVARARALASGHSLETAQIIADASAIGAAIDRAAACKYDDSRIDHRNHITAVSCQHELPTLDLSNSMIKVAYSVSCIAQALQISPIVHRTRQDAANILCMASSARQ